VEYRATLTLAGIDIASQKEVAIKLMENRNGSTILKEEAEMYKQLQGETGFPKVYWSGSDVCYDVLVFELLGPSLADLFEYCERKFSLKTILLIADQAITRIECIHKYYLHRDIKPENFLLGTREQGNIIYAVDFGLAKEFSEEEEHKGYRGLAFEGTHRYASINCHDGLGRRSTYAAIMLLLIAFEEPSWRDDLESLGYVLLYFARGSLPWQGLKVSTSGNRNMLIRDKKASHSGSELCEGFLPKEFAEFIDYTRSLKFGEKPNYRHLRNKFRARFRAERFQYDNIFDWTERRFHEIRGELNPQDSMLEATSISHQSQGGVEEV
jgi:serine/threonine protein kinase